MELITPERFREFRNKTILVGITYLHEDESISHIVQFAGVITNLDSRGLVINKNIDGEEFCVPADDSAIEYASEGKYTLKTTGEVIINPDYLTTWTIYLKER